MRPGKSRKRKENYQCPAKVKICGGYYFFYFVTAIIFFYFGVYLLWPLKIYTAAIIPFAISVFIVAFIFSVCLLVFATIKMEEKMGKK